LKSISWPALFRAQSEEAVIMPCLKKAKLIDGTLQFFHHKAPLSQLDLFGTLCHLRGLLRQRAWLRDNRTVCLNRTLPRIQEDHRSAESEATEIHDLSDNKGILEVLEKMYDK
jgi:hypothetical protein